MEVTFRRLIDGDLPTLHRWLNEPGVVRWWEGDDVSWDAVVREYGSTHPEPVEHWLFLLDGRASGWIQVWAVADEPEETAPWLALGVDRDGAGIDYLIGEPQDRGRGLGSRAIGAFVRDVVFAPGTSWTQACAAPYEANVASWRALEKAGFSFAGIVQDADGPCRLMVRARASAEGGADPAGRRTPH